MRKPQKNQPNVAVKTGRAFLKVITALIAFLLLLIVAAGAVIWVFVKGPSPTMQRDFVLTVKETSAVGFLANIFLTDAEIERIIGEPETEEDLYEIDVTLINIPSAKPPIPPPGVHIDSEELPEEYEPPEDIDEIEIVRVVGSGYLGYMMIVHDPMRLFVGTPSNLGGRGMTLMDMVERTGAVAGINAGGFFDPGGGGTGGIPDGIVIADGKLAWGAGSGSTSVIGFDADGILHVGTMTAAAAVNLNLQWAVSFGPTLISNGVAHNLQRSGINPRTAIGQRADGAVLLLVVEGRQIDSLGATFDDLIEIFLDFDAVNAANLDGGSSTLMMFEDEIINRSASVVGPRNLPTSFLVR